jgi:DNA repair protein RecO (recombination protein O)
MTNGQNLLVLLALKSCPSCQIILPPMLVTTPAVILSTLRYSESSKIVRLATREHGVLSAIAKGALRPRSRFGASLQVLSEGTAHVIVLQRRELQLLTAFDVGRVHLGLAADLPRYATAMVLAELVLRLAPPDPDPGVFDLLVSALGVLDSAPAEEADALGLRLIWLLVSALGFAPALDACVLDGSPLPDSGPLPFSTQEGGALCAACARGYSTTRLPADAREALVSLLDASGPLPRLDPPNLAAHRRLLARFIRQHMAEGAALSALEFWEGSRRN